MSSLLLAALLWLVTGLGLFALRRRDLLHPAVLALVATALIGSFHPLLSAFVTPETWRNAATATEREITAVQGDYLAFALALAVTLLLLLGRRRRAPDATQPAPAYLRHRDAWVALALAGSGALLYSQLVAAVGTAALFNREDLAEKHLLSASLGPLLYGMHFLVLSCLWVEGSDLGRAWRVGFRLLGALLALWSVAFLSARGNAVALGLGYMYLGCRRRGLELRHLRLSRVALVALGWLLLEAFALSRGQADAELGSVALGIVQSGPQDNRWLAVMLGSSELAHPFFTSLELAQTRMPGELGGATYLQAPLMLVPLLLNPDRPHTLAQAFAEENYPALFERGGGAAFSLVGEAWWNFGPLVGPLLLGLAVGAALTAWESGTCRRPAGVLARATPFLVYHVTLLHRYEAASLVKQALFVLLPLGALALLARIVWQGSGRTLVRTAAPGSGSTPRTAALAAPAP